MEGRTTRKISGGSYMKTVVEGLYLTAVQCFGILRYSISCRHACRCDFLGMLPFLAQIERKSLQHIIGQEKKLGTFICLRRIWMQNGA